MTLAPDSPKQHKCKQCGKRYVRTQIGQKVCSPGCAILFVLANPQMRDRALKHASAAQNKVIRAAKKAAKEKIMTRSDWLKRAQAAFNRWVRLRDRGQPCISCGCTLEGRKVDAGHYRTVGAMPATRFEPLNCHSQCVPCNQHKSGNILEYRLGLIRRIGLENVEWLEQDHPPQKYTIDEIKEIESHYKNLCKEIEHAI